MARRRHRWPLGRRSTALIAGLVLIFVALRLITGLAQPATPTSIFTSNVVVVGVQGHDTQTPTDRSVIAAHAGDVQAGAVSVRGRYRGSCAAAGWTTLGAGRRAAVADLCTPQVSGGRITDWDQRLSAASARDGDARLGTLADSVPSCIQAVGGGAALAAAKPDGTVAHYQSVTQFLGDGMRLSCPLTLVDAGAQSDQVITALARQSGITTVVTGIGPPTGSSDDSLQLIYRVGTTFPGLLTSDSTRRTGIVNLTDLTATLIDYATTLQHPASKATLPSTIDGAVFAVDEQPVTPAVVDQLLHQVRALSDSVLIGYLANGALGALVSLGIIVAAVRRRWPLLRICATIASVWLACMMLPGAVDWAATSRPALSLTLLCAGWLVIMTTAALLLSRRTRVPAVVLGAGLTFAAFTVEAALGGVMEPGSMLNSRPIYGGRWYGFGNVTFSAYAFPALFLAGYLAHRFRARGQQAAAVVAVLVVGFGMIICEGWPSMGSDFGGVIAMTPAVLWLALVTSRIRVTWTKLVAIGLLAVFAISVISILDWLRGPGRRSHLGNFVQRIIDGDATDVVLRKAATSAETVVSPLGIPAVVVGVALWILIFRFVLPRVSAERYTGLRNVMLAVLITAVLGTVLNDGGAAVWLTTTAAAAAAALGLLIDEQLPGLPLPRNPEHPSGRRSGSPANRIAPDPMHLHDQRKAGRRRRGPTSAHRSRVSALG